MTILPTGAAARPGRGLTGTDGLLALMALIWGVNFIVAKAALGIFKPLAFNAIRFAIASVALLLIARSRGRGLPGRRHWRRIIGYGIVGNTLYQVGFIEGLARTRAGNAALIMAAIPVLTAVASHSRGHERLRWRDTAGLLLSALGVASIVLGSGVEFGFGVTIAGDLMVLGATVCWAVYTVGTKPLVDELGPVTTTVWTMVLGILPMMLLAIPSLVRQPWASVTTPAWGAVLYASLLSIVVAYLIWYRGVQRLGSTRAALYSNFTPVFAVLAAWPLLGEVPTQWQVLGGAAIFAGMYLTRS